MKSAGTFGPSGSRGVMRFRGKVAVITGGGSGIGEATARLMAADGAVVILTGRREEKLAAVAREIREAGGKADAVAGSVTSDGDVRAAVELAVNRHGGIHVLVNNAGSFIEAGWLHETSDQGWTQTLDVFLNGTFRTCRAAIPHMQAGGGGAIVNVSSVSALVAVPGFFAHAYACAKAGVNILTRNIAIQYAEFGIRCNAVCPAAVDTTMLDGLRADAKVWEAFNASYPVGRVGRPDEIARAIAYLASEEAAWVTGTVLTLDGGITAKTS